MCSSYVLSCSSGRYKLVVVEILYSQNYFNLDSSGTFNSVMQVYIIYLSQMEGGNQLPIAQETQAQAPSAGQSIMSQMPPPGQQQPDYDQVPAGQPATTSDDQPVQYNDVPVMQLGEQGHQEQPEQPVQSGHTGEAAQPQQQPGQGLDLTIDTDFLKSPLCFIKVAEFVSAVFSLI